MPDFGAPVAQNVNTDPNKGLSTISSLMGLQQQKQALQAQNLEIQQRQLGLQSTGLDIQGKEAQLPATQATAGLQVEKAKQAQTFSSMLKAGIDDQGNSLRGEDGDLDPVKVTMAAGRVAPLAPEIAQGIIRTHTDKVGLQSASQSLDASGRKLLQGPLQAVALNPTDEAIGTAQDTIKGLVEQHPELAPAANHVLGLMPKIGATQDPAQRAKLANSLSAMVQPGEAVQTQPQAAAVDNGSNILQGTVAPPAAGGGFTPASNVHKNLSPQVIMDAGGQPHFIGGDTGPASGHGGGTGGGTGGGAGGSWPSSTDVQAKGAAAADMSNHFAGLNSSAQSVPLVTSLTKTIESLAPTAFTGPGGDKRQYMAGLARVFGVNTTGNAQTDTNLLNKAMAQLNINTPAGTDAARALVEAGQPNSHMDPAAIKEAAGTIAAQVKMNAAERDFLQTTRYSNRGAGDPEAYQEGRQKFEANADPRLWQYNELRKTDPAAAKAFMARQPDRADLVRKGTALHDDLGFFR